MATNVIKAPKLIIIEKLFSAHSYFNLIIKINLVYLHSGSKDIITPFLTSIAPLLCKRISFHLVYIFITIADVDILKKALISPFCQLHTLRLDSCTISSSDYYDLTTAIATSNLKIFECSSLSIDVAAAKGLAIALKESKSLKLVEVREDPMDTEVARLLVEAMNHSEVETLAIGPKLKDIVSNCSYPKGKVIDTLY